MAILYVTERGATLAARSRSIIMRCDGEVRRQVPAINLERVAVLAPAHITSEALALCAREGIEIVLATRGIQVLARLGWSESGLALRALHHERAADVQFRVGLARAIVRGKLRNQRRLLGRSRGGRGIDLVKARVALSELLDAVETAPDLPALRGVEGRGAAAYFRGLGGLVNAEYGFGGRNRRPPRDPANAMLSFAYTLLTAEAAAALAAAGLEPALGLFHDPRRGRPALALDLVEEFRAPVGDALLLQVTGRRMVRPSQFQRADRGVLMSPDAKRRFLSAYEQKMVNEFRDGANTPTNLRSELRSQAAKLAETMRHGNTYDPFQLP